MLKPGVRIQGVRPEVAFVMPHIYAVATKWLGGCTVTSCVEGKHSRGSLHYAGCAIDLRTRDAKPEWIDNALIALKGGLGDDFDVVREPDHIHIEYQPKEPH